MYEVVNYICFLIEDLESNWDCYCYSDELSWLHTSTKPEAEVQEKQQQK